MKKITVILSLFSLSCWALTSWAKSPSGMTQDPMYHFDDKMILGRVENVYYNISGLSGVPFPGKVDSGADTTSIHAEDIHLYSLNPEYKNLTDNKLLWAVFGNLIGTQGQWDEDLFSKAKWSDDSFKPYKVHVTFNITHPYTGKKIKVDRDLERIGVIRSRSSSTPILRPVINLPLTISGKTIMTEVNLTNRNHFSAPILIGKTYLKDHALVMAGYEYLQEQPKATLIGKKETVHIYGVPYQVSISLSSKYSNAHALDIKIDRKNSKVSFVLEGENKEHKPITLPLVRMLKTSKGERPLVYLPVKINQKINYWLVYLSDRGNFKSQIRLGQNVIDQHYVVDTEKENILAKSGAPFNKEQHPDSLIISPNEKITIDDKFEVPAYPTFTVKTPLLKLPSYKTIKNSAGEKVVFSLKNDKGEFESITKDVIKNIKVGERIRPVVSGNIFINNKNTPVDFALAKLKPGKIEPSFILGHKMIKGSILVNSRTENLLSPHPLFIADHIELATVEGLIFPVKLDTGADMSSINAQNIKLFQKNGKEMVSFLYRNNMGQQKEFTRDVVGIKRIKAKKGEKPNVRPVVEMQVRLGKLDKKIRVNLQDRDRFHYSMILGKNFLKYGVIVNSD
ncbi:putative ATP-dependent zinc protease [Dongshaea marina]|uniref:putative ATP-dependent zinc protease n=1 Tax=Dongshaea marina TaxID=2047966 RepID=UPI000D3E0687|nr:RimK/LysX family protein [Dongshaea marina]